MDHIWRQKQVWRREEAQDGWQVERLYTQSFCTTCGEIRGLRALGKRRRCHMRIQAKPGNVALETLPVKQWRSLDILIRALHQNRLQLLETLGTWLETGWIEVEETLMNQEWQIERVRLAAQAAARQAEQQRTVQTEREQYAVRQMSTVLEGWQQDYQIALALHQGEADLLAVLTHIGQLLDEQTKALAVGTCVPLPGTAHRKGGTTHQRWIAILRGLVNLLAYPRTEYERVFSATWLGGSKVFMRDRTAIAQFLSIPGGFERIGLVKHTPVVYCWGAWQATMMTYTIDGRAGVPFVSITADTIAQLQHVCVHADQLIVIENQTVFEMMLHPTSRQVSTLYLFGAGFPGHAERALVAVFLHAKPDLPWFIWTDCDIGGVHIQQHWYDWAMRMHLPSPQPYGWTQRALLAWQPVGVPLTADERKQLKNMAHPLAQMLYACGYTVEQEAMMSGHMMHS
jgi:hypothetical protein